APVKAAVKKVVVAAAKSEPVAPAPVPAKKAVVKKAPAKKPAAKTVVTKVIAKVDAGFGNSLFIRGTGPGMSWETGVAMSNVSADTWEWTTTSAKSAFECKLLLNDETWALGEDILVSVGASVTVEPSFQ
ncbi:hypothetical protein RZS08_25735, partial [Arthrospira platensis SPKY1]|nr:hypothetical protein [Arthrospira platensis SPKY1]